MVNLGSEKCIRCLNCWKLYPNSKGILDHWVNGKCLFYCSICGQSFHDNIKTIREHFPVVHGIRYRIPERASKIGVKELSADKKKTICTICNITFANKYARNSHMRCHKKENVAKKATTQIKLPPPNRVSSPATSIGSTGSSDSRKRSGSVKPADIKPVPARKPAPKRRMTTLHPPTFNTQSSVSPRRTAVYHESLPGPSNSTFSIKTESVEEDPGQLNLSEFLITDVCTRDVRLKYSNSPESTATTENGGPRLQVKKLIELQEPGLNGPDKRIPADQRRLPISDTFYSAQTPFQQMQRPQSMIARTNTMPLHMQQRQPNVNYMNHNMSPPPAPVMPPHMTAVQSPTQFQISQAQQIQQQTQYYNPVYVVQQPQHGGLVNHPTDPNSYHHQPPYGEFDEYGQYYV